MYIYYHFMPFLCFFSYLDLSRPHDYKYLKHFGSNVMIIF